MAAKKRQFGSFREYNRDALRELRGYLNWGPSGEGVSLGSMPGVDSASGIATGVVQLNLDEAYQSHQGALGATFEDDTAEAYFVQISGASNGHYETALQNKKLRFNVRNTSGTLTNPTNTRLHLTLVFKKRLSNA